MPPTFRKTGGPIIESDQPWEGPICSVTSGLLREEDRWRLWYSNGFIGADQAGAMRVAYAESADGQVWSKPHLANGPVPGTNIVLPREDPKHRVYLPSVHREAGGLVAFCWCEIDGLNGLFRFEARDGQTFERHPRRPLFASPWGSAEARSLAGEGRVCNDAFSITQHADGSYALFSAYLQPNADARTRFGGDNLAAYRRVICRADSADGIDWSRTRVIIEPDYAVDSYETQFYGMHVFRHGGLHLGLLHTYYLDRQIIQPEWAWSRDGWTWRRTHAPCLELGAEGSFDSRMILFGDTTVAGDELVWIYNGANWRHNDYASPDIRTCIGRATLALYELDAWIGTLAP